MFEAIRDADYAKLRELAKTFVGTGKDAAVLLCLDHVFSSPLKLQNLPFIEIQAWLSLYLDYIRRLNKLMAGKSVSQGSDRQRLLGFQVLRGNRYRTPKHTLLHDKFVDRSGPGRKGTEGDTHTSEELRKGIVELIESRISDRTKVQDSACRDVHGFSPCLYLLVGEKCRSPGIEGSCTFQHIQPEQLTVDWYHARLRLIFLQLQILNLARYCDLRVTGYVLAHSAKNM